MIARLPCPSHLDPETLLAEVHAEIPLPFSVEADEEIVFRFDDELTIEQQAQLAAVVAAHDGSAAIADRAAKKERSEQILADNQALVDQARAKRLAGETLTTQELAAIADLFMFQGFQPQ
jgi:hypothetical protein